ncbi:hypothetical protein FQA39_LY13786 [Lamprigera yunnana]|nr:hypothetical protein FQA39_LY13786 [Lamprigera yunnana]
MPDANLEERDCTHLCKSVEHGNIVCATITKRQVSDSDMCAYIQSLCGCCQDVKDNIGRTALHIAASCGRIHVIQWLIKCKQANINIRDLESGYTPLHRSIFYGKINAFIYLTRLGANASIMDFNNLTSLEHAVKDSNISSQLKMIYFGEVYVWGTNTNYVFGTQETRSTPEMLYGFHKEHSEVAIQQICVENFHSVMLSVEGRVFACGHGQGGRLGLGSENTAITPKEIKFKANGHPNFPLCKEVSIATDHSIFFMNSGSVWTTGVNTHKVLGIQPSPTHTLTPLPLPRFTYSIQGVCAAKYHSVAWGRLALYTWGLHGGQLGHEKSHEKYVVTPKFVNCFLGQGSGILDVSVSIGATAILTSRGDIFIMYEYHCKKILKNQLNIISVTVVGGKLNEKLDNCLLGETDYKINVVAVSHDGNLYLWQNSVPQFARCIFSINRSFNIRNVALNMNEILFITNEGEAFSGVIKFRKTQEIDNSVQLQKNGFRSGHLVKITKIPNVHRAVSIHTDPKGRNFAVIQVRPNNFIHHNQPLLSGSLMDENLSMLLQETENDLIHDVVFYVVNKYFRAHRYIIASSSSVLYNLINNSKNAVVEINGVHPDIFEQLLLFIYTGTCCLLKTGMWQFNTHVCTSEKNLRCPLCIDNKNPVRLLQNASEKFGVTIPREFLESVYYENHCLSVQDDFKICTEFDHTSFQELYNVIIKTKDGFEIPAHKCILSARLEYFNNLFSVRWNEDAASKVVSLSFSYKVCLQLIEFLYTDAIPNLRKQETDNICQLLIAADQLFVTRLKELCENVLASHVTLKNIVDLFTFASFYRARQLKNYCMEFICVNLSNVLELRILEMLDDDLLLDVTEFYAKFNPLMEYRILTPYSHAPSDEEVLAASNMHPISYDVDDVLNVSNRSITKTQKRRSRPRKYSSTDYNQGMEDSITVCTQNENSLPVYELPQIIHVESNEVLRVKSRLKALKKAKNIVDLELTELSLQSNRLNLKEFPELSCSPISSSCSSKVSPNKLETKHKIIKVSQKEQKRLCSEGSLIIVDNPSPPAQEWPKNPWKLPLPKSDDDDQQPASMMQSIIMEEKKLKQNFVKMKTKMLIHTQTEDRAIEDLSKFYNTTEVFDEIITVRRVPNDLIASPVWVK